MIRTLTAAAALLLIAGTAAAQTSTTRESYCTSGKYGTRCYSQTIHYGPPAPPPKTAAELRTPSSSPRVEVVGDNNPLTQEERAAMRATRPGPKEVPLQ